MSNGFQQRWESLAVLAANLIVRLWPSDTKDWARAFAAELPEAETISQSLRWLLGGVMLLTRERFRDFLKSLTRPMGVQPDGPLEAGCRLVSRFCFPRTPRWMSLLVLAASLVILLHSETRTSLRAAVWRDLWTPQEWSTLHTLQNRTAQTGDAKLLALLSLLSSDNSDRARLSNEAIAKDASFTWLDYRYFRPPDTAQDRARLHASANERLQRLQKWDPDNAVPRLYAAELLFEDIVAAVPGVSSFPLRRRTKMTQLEKIAAENREWLALMDNAFRAPRYDTYASRRLDLVRNIARQYRINDPDVTEYAVGGGVLPQFPNLLTYAHVLLYRNLESGTHAADGSAIADAWSVLHFAQRMHLRGLTRIEDIIASEMAQQACERLRPLLKTSGRADEAASVALEQERWNVAVERLRSRNRSWSSSIVGGSLQWAGLTIHIAAFTAIGLLAASLLAFGFFSGTTGSTNASYGRFSTFLSVMADVAPPIALLACVTLFAVYHPYARTYESYFRANAPSLTAESMEELSAAAAVPYMMPAAVEMQSEKFTYLAWLSVTVVLSTFAALLMFRMWWHRRAA